MSRDLEVLGERIRGCTRVGGSRAGPKGSLQAQVKKWDFILRQRENSEKL